MAAPTTSRADVLTVAAIAVVAYGLANQVHEALGHGGACLAAGCTPELLTAVSFYGNEDGLSQDAVRFISAGGTLANFAAALVGGFLLRGAEFTRGGRWLFAWIFTTINLMQATGYLFFSGVANIGDWAAVVRDLPHPGTWRIALAVIGGAAYWFVADRAIKRLTAHIPGIGKERLPAIYRITLTAYLAGAALYLSAGIFNPGGFEIVLVSAVAASLGGTSGLAWAPQSMRNPAEASFESPALAVERDWRWIAAAAAIAVPYVAVLGPGLPL